MTDLTRILKEYELDILRSVSTDGPEPDYPRYVSAIEALFNEGTEDNPDVTVKES